MTDAKPYPKASQLARGERRYRRKVASPKQWQAIIEAKRGPCRVCSLAYDARAFSFHHLVPRAMHGDDVADNLVPLCGDGTQGCHGVITRGWDTARELLACSLTDAEYAYVVGKLGEGGMARLFGVGRS